MMYGNGYGQWGNHYGMFGGTSPDWALALFAFMGPLIVVVVLWSVFWKGLALWHSARRGQPWWFVILIVVNTLGILEIIYLFGVASLKWRELFDYKEHHTHHPAH